MAERDPVDCMICLAHPWCDSNLAVVEQAQGRVFEAQHVVSGWRDEGYGTTLCGLRVRPAREGGGLWEGPIP